jgi:NAD(P)-dependent dehydrogenase (short-subunit alcohol dehydrogenase family)
MDLEGTCAIVTGGASGLGAATVTRLMGAGAQVFAFDLPGVVVEKPSGAGDHVSFVDVDVTDPAQIRSALDLVAASGRPLRSVINCAGIGPSIRILGRKGVHDLDVYAAVVGVNLIGTFNVLALASELMAQTSEMKDGARGVIINTASVAAFDGQVGQAAYASSKGGVVGLTLPAARDLAQYGIRVCTVAPGIIDTPLLATLPEEVRASLAAGVPFPQRLGTPEEYADLVMAIIRNDYLNGETIRMDGALRMAPR